MTGRQKPQSPWIPPGQAVRVGRYQISGGMIYVGQGRNLRGKPEPSLINPALPLEPASRLQLPRDGWVAYSHLVPAVRASYLEWLAGGRCDLDAPQLFLYLFFCGLERRAFFDLRTGTVSNAEILLLVAEAERLLEIYGRHSRFAYCAAYFIALARLLTGNVQPEALEPLLERFGARSPVIWEVGPALFAAAGRPPSPRWAFALWSRWDLARRAAPAFRCPTEVRDLFLIHYSQILPAVPQFRQGRAPLVVRYHPVNPSLPVPFALKLTGIREVSYSRTQMAQLQRVADRVFSDLAPYSRWVGRVGTPTSPAALAILPPELARGWESEESRRLVRWIEKMLAGEGCAVLRREDVVRHWPVEKPRRLDRRAFEEFATFLARSGYGMEPEPRLGGTVPERGFFLFRLPDPEAGWTWLPSPAYTTAVLVLQLAVAVATADGPADPQQEEHLLAHVMEAAHLEPMERARLQIRLAWLLAETQSLAGCRERCSALAEPQRRALACFLIIVAGADGHVSPGEIRQLKKVYRLLGRDPQALYADVHAIAAEPVTVRPAALGPGGFAIPAPTPEPGLTLDPGKIRHKSLETEQVSSLLEGIFAADDEPVRPAAVPSTGETVAGLDAVHSALLRQLAARTTWERLEVERLTAGLGLLPDGALEILNEAAFARCDAPLLEGDERIDIDPEILEELLA